jgi:TolB-like protein
LKSKYALQLITLFLAVSAAAGCQSIADKMAPAKADEATRGQQEIDMSPENINKKVTALATQLVDNIKQYRPDANPVVVTTFVNIDSLQSTSQFGRYVSERLVYDLHKMGFQVFEIRQSKWIRVLKRKGEFHLTREARDLLNRYRSDAVIVGTYLVVDSELALQVRMLDRDTSRIISVASMEFNLDEDPYLRRLVLREDAHIDVSTSLVPLEER